MLEAPCYVERALGLFEQRKPSTLYYYEAKLFMVRDAFREILVSLTRGLYHRCARETLDIL